MTDEQYEQILLDMTCDLERMSFLERKSWIRLQVVSRAGRNCLRSIEDSHRVLRMCVVRMLLQGCRQGNLGKFKQIVYSAQLESLSLSQGLLKEQLHKTVAVQLAQMMRGNLEETLLASFNCVAFFDEIVMQSFREAFPVEGQEETHWQRVLGGYGEGEGWVKGGEKWLLGWGRQEETSLEQVEVDVGVRAQDNLLTVSMDSWESPADNKENYNSQNQLHKSRKITMFEPLPQPLPPQKEKTRPFWTLFCCGAD